MAQRSNTGKYDQVIVTDEKQVKPSQEVSVDEESRKLLRLTYPVRYVYRSKATGETYTWERAGSEVSVHSDDAFVLLSKIRQSGCCGAAPQKYYLFEEVT